MRLLPGILLPLLALSLSACDDDAAATSKASRRFFLPTGEPTNTSAPVLETDASGRLHAAYPAYARGGAYYATCASTCSKPEDFSVVRLETVGTVANTSLAVTAEGHPRLLLSTGSATYFATCDTDCATPGGWTTTRILDHGGVREVTGEALALDPAGRPRFLSHTYRAYLGVGQKPYETQFVQCDADCSDPASWRASAISQQNWQGTHLRFDGKGRAHVATVASDWPGAGPLRNRAAYLVCDADCDRPESWNGTGLVEAYENLVAAVRMEPTVSLALTKDGRPRVLTLAKRDDGQKSLIYFACDDACTNGDRWTGIRLSDQEKLAAGLDLALDAQDHPRYVYTLDYDIVLGRCDGDHCESDETGWSLEKVESGRDMKPDQIFLEPNCTVAAWFLHSPSLAIGADGKPRVGYQARDISGGLSRPDPNKPRCVAGTDMTWSRIALP